MERRAHHHLRRKLNWYVIVRLIVLNCMSVKSVLSGETTYCFDVYTDDLSHAVLSYYILLLLYIGTVSCTL